mgnify:FL=1
MISTDDCQSNNVRLSDDDIVMSTPPRLQITRSHSSRKIVIRDLELLSHIRKIRSEKE